MYLLKKIIFTFLLISLTCVFNIFAQDKKKETKKVNFGYSTNPPAKTAKKAGEKITKPKTSKKPPNTKKTKTTTAENKINSKTVETKDGTENKTVTVAKRTREVAKQAIKANRLPTDIYKVGVGDVLFINLQNSAAKYYTVLLDGTVDYPLAGKLVSVVDLTTDEIEELLREKITLYENPQVTVKVRDYASHRIKVKGLARVGDHFLQRESMPLVVIKTMVGVKAVAKTVTIERENSEKMVFDLSDEKVNLFLVQKGDVLTFEDSDAPQSKVTKSNFYFVGEKICSGGKRTFHKGITLFQAVFDVCGKLNKKLKKVTILRKTLDGRFVRIEYDFKAILNGKETDPVLQAGDMIDSAK